MILIILTIGSCKTSLSERLEPDIIVNPVPWLVYFEPDNPELKEIVLMQIEHYSYILELMIELESTGYADEVIEIEMDNCREAIKWLGGNDDR
ncbi:MAG: hypothetical protein GY804_04585 [Alphaproteobacteria bacterium]|nr:hypothetical protein [Alphaproteobacteria bacterium]